LIVAYSQNRVIGIDNQLPWRLPGDLAHFKRQTLGHPIIMGRKTWVSIGRPLPGRTNIVVSRSGQGDFTGAVLVDSLEAALKQTADQAQVFIIGGAQLYREALPAVDQIIATEVHAHIDGDAFFPELADSDWVETDRQPQPPENGLAYDFVQYRRR
jgi:dihydrofolate reductase